jgi:hypothetical protein
MSSVWGPLRHAVCGNLKLICFKPRFILKHKEQTIKIYFFIVKTAVASLTYFNFFMGHLQGETVENTKVCIGHDINCSILHWFLSKANTLNIISYMKYIWGCNTNLFLALFFILYNLTATYFYY